MSLLDSLSPKNLQSSAFLIGGVTKHILNKKKYFPLHLTLWNYGRIYFKKKVLEFDLEGVRLSIQKEGQEKFEAKIVLDTLKDFTEKIDQIEPADRPHLFQYLIKSISYFKLNNKKK